MLNRLDLSISRHRFVYLCHTHNTFHIPSISVLLSLLQILSRCITALLRQGTILPILFILSSIGQIQCQTLSNLSIPVTSTQLVYTPFICNETTSANNPSSCLGAWRIVGGTPDSSKDLIASTNGSAGSTGNIIPQVFFRFRAFKLHLSTSDRSDALVNLTISTPTHETIWTTFNSSLGAFSILQLDPKETSQLAITYLSDNLPGAQFEIDSIELTVEADATISSFLPTPTLPPSASLPTFVLPSSRPSMSSNATAQPSSVGSSSLTSRKTFIAMAVGLTVGLGLGLTALTAIIFIIWRRRRRRNELEVPDNERPGTRMADSRSEWREGTDGTISPHWSWRRVGLGSTSNRGQVSPIPSVGRSAASRLGNHFVNGHARERNGS